MSTFRFTKRSRPLPTRGDGADIMTPGAGLWSPRRASIPAPRRPSRRIPPPANETDSTPWLADRPGEAEALVHFACEPGSNLLADVHEFVAAYAKLRFRPSVAQRVDVASHELFSNALSYGSVSNEVVFELLEWEDRVAVRVSNDAIRSRIEMLSSQILRLKVDPERTFVEETRRDAVGAMRAMLGLARVRYEAQMDLELIVDEPRIVVCASCVR